MSFEHGWRVPPKRPFWQSKMKQKSAAAKADPMEKLTHPVVPEPAARYAPPSTSPTVITIRRERERMPKALPQ